MNQNKRPRLSIWGGILGMVAVLWTMYKLQAEILLFVAQLTIPSFLNTIKFDTMLELVSQCVEYIESSQLLGWVSLIYSIVGATIFFFWYRALRKDDGLKLKKLNTLTNRPGEMIAGLLLTCVALGFVAQAIISVITIILPKWMMEYEELLEQAGFTDVTLVLLLYACIFGPIIEELGIRGVGFTYARRAFGPVAALIMQALLFGIMHMNKVQFVYTFFVGLAFGYMVMKFESLWISIFAHILYNFVATFGAALVMVPVSSPIVFYLTVFGSLAVLYAGILLLKKSAPLVKEVGTGSDN